MKRYPHYWWKLRGKYCPGRLAVLDCDTAPGTAGNDGQPCPDRVTRWSLCTADMRNGVRVGGQQHSGDAPLNLWRTVARLCSSREVTWIWIPEALTKLIALGFFAMLELGEMKLCGRDWTHDRGDGRTGEDRPDGLMVIQDPPTLISCRPRGTEGKILFLDVRNHGVEPYASTHDIRSRVSGYMVGILSIVRSLRQDRAVSLRGTAASQAVQILRTRYDCVRLHCHTHGDAIRLERAAYFGGRCQAFRTGELEGPIYHLDIRNCYPAVAMDMAVPVSLREYTDDERRATRLVREYPGCCVADVTIRRAGDKYPQRKDGGIHYPSAGCRTTLAGPELQRAANEENLVRVHAASWYTTAPILRDFYRDGLAGLAGARARGETILEQFWKRCLNALVGKFAEPGRRWVPCPYVYHDQKYVEFSIVGHNGQITRYRNIGFNSMRLEEHGESYWSMPAVAGWITSAARLRLWHYIETAGRQNVWYVDTDSIICGQAGYDRLLRAGAIRDGEAGHLRLIGQHSSGTIYGTRHYQLDNTVSCAGIPRGSMLPGETREDWFRRKGTAAKTTLERIGGISDG